MGHASERQSVKLFVAFAERQFHWVIDNQSHLEKISAEEQKAKKKKISWIN